MKRRTVAALGLLLGALSGPARAQDVSPHKMTNPDGSLDLEKCSICHEANMSLKLAKGETCTVCHSETAHGGSLEHLRASPSSVANAVQARPTGAVALPLTEDGHVYCGTCHLFHDPKVAGEKWLPEGWVPPETGLPGAVRQSILERWSILAKGHDTNAPLGEFAMQGTRQLRLPVNDSSLCRECHSGLK